MPPCHVPPLLLLLDALLLCCLATAAAATAAGNPGPPPFSSSSPEPSSAAQSPPAQFGEVGRPKALACNVSGSSNVTWCKMSSNSENCVPYPWSSGPSGLYKPVIVGKELWFKYLILSDSGEYRCNSSDGEEDSITLKVINCDRDRGIAVEAKPGPRQAVPVGGSLSLNCSALFPCPSSWSTFGQPLASWSWHPTSPALAARLTRLPRPLDPDTMKSGEVLTLRNVTEKDYGTRFRCRLHEDNSTETFEVEIVRPEKPDTRQWRLVVAFVSLAVCLVVVVSLGYYFRNVLKFHLGRRPKRSAGEENDALLLPSDVTEQFVRRHVKPHLTQHQYRLLEVPPNRCVLGYITEALPLCTSVLVVRADSEEEEQTWRFLCRAILPVKGGNKVVLIHVPDKDVFPNDSSAPGCDGERAGTADADSSDSVFLRAEGGESGAATPSGVGEGAGGQGEGAGGQGEGAEGQGEGAWGQGEGAGGQGEGVGGQGEGAGGQGEGAGGQGEGAGGQGEGAGRQGEGAGEQACQQFRWPGNQSRGPRCWNFWYGLRCFLPQPAPSPRRSSSSSSDDVARRPGHSSTSSGSYLLTPHSSAGSDSGQV